MSKKSYRQNLDLGVTGPDTPTCLSASLEQLFQRGSLLPDDHRAYADYVTWYNGLSRRQRYIESPSYAGIFDRLVGRLGGLSCEQARFHYPKSQYAFSRLVNLALRQGCKVIVDITIPEGSHALGILPGKKEGKVELVSTWLPEELGQQATTAQLYPLLSQSEYLNVPKKYWRDPLPFDDANVIILPGG